MHIPSDYATASLSSVYSTNAEQVRARRTQEDAAARPAPEQGPDTVTVSADARMLARMTETAQAAPDIRADKVAELKAQVDGGTYTMDNRAIAQSMLRDDVRIFG